MPKTLTLLRIAAIILALSFPHHLMAQQCLDHSSSTRPTIGLALGGGGARGYAHIGVIKYLEQMRIPFHYISGTSMGSIVGGLAATGMSADELGDVVQHADWPTLFSDATPRQDLPARRKAEELVGLHGPKFGLGKNSSVLPAGVMAGQNIQFMFESITSSRLYVSTFDELPVPFRAIATDIVTGSMVVIKDGSLAAAMRASMSVPGIFDPVRSGERLLVDGGLVRNVPIDVVRELGADIVIAVDVGTPLMAAEAINDVLAVVEQMSSLTIVQNTVNQIATLGENDVLIRPSLGDEITSSSFESFSEAMPLGYAAALEMSEELQALSLSEADYAAWRQRLSDCVKAPGDIQFIRLDNQSRFDDEVIRRLITLETGQPLDMAQLEKDLQQIYGLGFIRLASYRMVDEGDQLGVEIQVLQDERGSNFLESGLTLAGSGRGTTFNVQLGYLKTDIDQFGSEFRTAVQMGDDLGIFTDFYKYFEADRQWVVNPRISASRRDILVFDDAGLALGVAEIEELGAGIRFGREFGRWGSLFLGADRFTGSVGITVGNPFVDEEFDGGEWSIIGVYDRLDDLFLPKLGSRMEVKYLNSEEQLGADEEFEQILLRAVHSRSFGRHNFIGGLRFDTTIDGEVPIYALFTGGGFLNMSGFEPNELVGSHFGVASLGYRYEVFGNGFLPGYVGTTFEYGNSANERSDVFGDGILNGSVYFGYNTPIGPLYLGYGWNTESSGVLFLNIGTAIGGRNIGSR